MKKIIGLLLLFIVSSAISAQDQNQDGWKEELTNLSKQKWQWMAEQNVDSLNALFLSEAVFVHMGATFTKDQELEIIKNKEIVYKNAEIEDISIRVIDNVAIVLDKIRLTAIVGGNEVVNPFVVTEVYLRIDNRWKLASLSFTRLLGE